MWLKQVAGSSPTLSTSSNPMEWSLESPFHIQEQLCAATELLATILPNVFVEVSDEGSSNDSIYCTALDELNFGCEVFHAQTIEQDRGPLKLWTETPAGDPKYLKRQELTFPLRNLTHDEGCYEWERDAMIFPETEDPFPNGAPKPVKRYSVRDFQDKSIDLLYIDCPSDRDTLAAQIRAWTPKLSRNGVILLQVPEAQNSLRDEQGIFHQVLAGKPQVQFACPEGLMLITVGNRLPKSVRQLLKRMERETLREPLSVVEQPVQGRKTAGILRLLPRMGRWLARRFTRTPNPLYEDLIQGASSPTPYVPQSLGTATATSESKSESPISTRG